MANGKLAAAVAAACILAAGGGLLINTQPWSRIEASEGSQEAGCSKSAGSQEAAFSKMEAASTAAEETSPADVTNSAEDMEVEEILFRNAVGAVQMEITTGLTTEYLNPLMNYPVLVVRGEETITINDRDELDAIGLDALYTPELLEAVEAADPDAVEIKDWKAVLGNPDTAYVVIGRDEHGIDGITEFHYKK